MSRLMVIITLSYFFADYSLAAPQEVGSLNTAYINLGSGFAGKPSKATSKLITRAHELIGTPYRWGGTSVSKGFDCSGLLIYLFRSEADIHLPRTTSSMLNSSYRTVERRHLKPGDAVFFKHNGRQRIKHAGIYIGGNQFIHAPRTGKNVRIDSLNNHYWNKTYLTAKRFH